MKKLNFKNLKVAIKKILFPADYTCELCGKEIFGGRYFCDDCLKILPFNDNFICLKCGRKIKDAYPVCLQCKSNMPTYSAARSPFSYQDEMVKLIKKFKMGSKYLADVFVGYLKETFLEHYGGCDYIISVPTSEKSLKRRGYDQAELLAEKLAKEVGVIYLKGALVKTRETADQKSLSQKERAENLKGSFRVHERKLIKDKTVCLVDDVLTTGATANAVARALFKAKAQRVLVLTIASVPNKTEI